MCLNRLQTGYDETDRTLAEMFAAYATIALKNAQAYDGLQQEIQKRGKVEESLRSTNRDLAAALDELRNTQAQLIQQERLAAVGQLAAGIAHDFNNIMAAILLYAELLLRMPDLAPQSRKKINVIHHQGKRAADLTQQILDFGRKSIMKRQSLDIYAFLSEMVELLKRTLPEAIQLTLGGEGSACLVDADPTRLQQVIMNLAINARGAMPDGGSLHFAIKRIQVAPDGKRPLPTLTPGDWVQVTVTDTGAGIPADVLPHIFEPFFTTRLPHGSGLGLSQVYGIIKQHGGEIDVVTEVGKGTTFCLYLPALTVSQPTTPENHLSQLTPGQAETILVVEDDATLRAALKQSLESLGYHILDAANGEEALACFRQDNDRITLVLTDIVMPKMGGAALLNKLQAIKPALKAVVMTGYPAAEIKADLQSVNVMGWLQKPVNLQRLGKIVAQVIGNSPH